MSSLREDTSSCNFLVSVMSARSAPQGTQSAHMGNTERAASSCRRPALHSGLPAAFSTAWMRPPCCPVGALSMPPAHRVKSKQQKKSARASARVEAGAGRTMRSAGAALGSASSAWPTSCCAWGILSCATMATARLQYSVHLECFDTQSPENTYSYLTSRPCERQQTERHGGRGREGAGGGGGRYRELWGRGTTRGKCAIRRRAAFLPTGLVDEEAAVALGHDAASLPGTATTCASQ